MDQTFERTHYLNGAVKWEKRELAGVTYEVNYGHSQRGRITSYTGAQGWSRRTITTKIVVN